MRRLGAVILTVFLLSAASPAQALICGDNLIDLPAEQCDGTSDLACPGQCQSNCLCPLDHFQCYEVKRRTFLPLQRLVQDQFGSTTATVERAERFCRPANKENENPGAETHTNHLVGYRFHHAFTKVTNQELVNQFAGPGQMIVDVVRPFWLFTPSIVTLGPEPPVIDHFQCYKIKRSRGSPKFLPQTVSVVDATGSHSIKLTKPKYLCAPADKNNEDPGAETHAEHLVCFKGRSAFGSITNQFVDNQFGQQQLDLIHRVELCVPTSKNTVTTTTTSTTIATTSSTSTTTATPTTSSTSTTTATPTTSSTSSTTTSTTSTTLYGSPSRAFLDRVAGLLD